MKRTWRHPISGSKQYLRPERAGGSAPARWPGSRRSTRTGCRWDRCSMRPTPPPPGPDCASASPASWSSPSSPSWGCGCGPSRCCRHRRRPCRHRPTRSERCHRADPWRHPGQPGNAARRQHRHQQITFSRVSARRTPSRRSLAALIGETLPRSRRTINDKQYSPYKPVPILDNAPLPDVLYIKEHPAEFPGVRGPDHPAQLSPEARSRPGGQRVPGGPDPRLRRLISAAELKTLAAQGYQPGTRSARAGSSTSTSRACGAHPANSSSRSTPRDRCVGHAQDDPGQAGRQPRHQHRPRSPTGGRQRAGHPDSHRAPDARPRRQQHALPPAIDGSVVVMNPQSRRRLGHGLVPVLQPECLGRRDLPGQLRGPPGHNSLNNWAINSQLAPGSTFKLATATSALQTGLITPDTAYVDNGGYTAPNCTGPNCHLKVRRRRQRQRGGLQRQLGAHRVERCLLLPTGAEYWGGPIPVRSGADPDDGRPVRVRPAHRDRPPQRVHRSGRLAVGAGEAPPGEPDRLPEYRLVHGDNMELAFGQGER